MPGDKRVVTVQYRIVGGQSHPMVQFGLMVNGRVTQVIAYVDTGASYSLFDAQIAYRLGIKIKRGHLIHVRSVDGTLIPVWLHDVTILIGKWRIRAKVGFCERLGVGFNLLGRRDVFHMLAFTFNDRKQRLIITDAA